MTKNSALFIIFSFILFGFISQAYAQYGKISGKITDVETEQPLIGADVTAVGTAKGGFANEDGQYFILNLRPGTYKIKAHMVGYKTVIKTGVNISINKTTFLDFELKSSAIMGDSVTVVAERPVIRKDKTHSSTVMSSEQVTDAPIEGLREAVDLVAGISRSSDGTFQVRGGPTDDLKFYIDGVEQDKSAIARPGYGNNLDNRNWNQDFNPLAVEEMEVIIGGFNAEYGRAQSGVVNVVTKEGSKNLSSSVRLEIRPPGKYHWGPYLYSKKESAEWENWGDFTAWEEWNSTRPEDSRISEDSLHYLHDKWKRNHIPGSQHKGGAYDYRDLIYTRTLFSLSGPLGNAMTFFLSGEDRREPTRVPTFQQENVYQNLSLTVSFPFKSRYKLLFTGQASHLNGGNAGTYQGDIRNAGRPGNFKYALERENGRDEWINSQSIKWIHNLSQKAFYEVQFYHKEETARSIPIMISGANDPWWIVGGPWDEGYLKNNMGRSAYFEDSKVDVYELSTDGEFQVDANNMVEAGLIMKYWDLFVIGESLGPAGWIGRIGLATHYKGNPYYFAGYIQDKMEYGMMIANLGLRIDGYDVNTPFYSNRFNPFYQAEGSNSVGDPTTTMPESRVKVSPRLGLSYPITENTALHFQYGHFNAMPQHRYTMYRNTLFGWRFLGNPDMGFLTTISYEGGIQQSIGDKLRLEVTAYYNDRISQSTNLRIHAPTGNIRDGGWYLSYDNSGYGDSKGIEVNLETHRLSVHDRWYYKISYSLSRTTAGTYGAAEIWSEDPDDPRNKLNMRNANAYLTSSDRTHMIRSFVRYGIPEGKGVKIFGIRPFEKFMFSLIYTAQSGQPYTYVTSFDEYLDVVNNRRYPIEHKTDLRLNRRLTFGGIETFVGIRIENLFDNQWLTPMSTTELEDWVLDNVTIGDPESAQNKFNYFQEYRNEPFQWYLTLGITL